MKFTGKKRETISIIEEDATFEGTLTVQGKLIIRGTVKGTVVGDTVIIGETGSVYARIKAGSVTVGGTVDGQLRALRDLTILPTGCCRGKVLCRDVAVEPGGLLHAEVTRLSDYGSPDVF